MRRIVPKAEEEKKRKRNNIFVGIIVIIVMIGSVFGVVVGYAGNPASNSRTELEYNGQTFYSQQGFWVTQYRGLNMSFINSPENTGDSVNIENSLNSLTDYQASPLYIYSEDTMATSQIERNLGQVALRTQQVCLNEENCEGNLPVKDCSRNTVIVQEGPENKINQTDSCVYIEGSQQDLTRLTDEFIYRVSGLK